MVLILGSIVMVVVACVAYWYTTSLKSVGGPDETVIVTVEQGMNEAQIAAVLHNKGLIRSVIAYELYARISGNVGRMQAGGYKLTRQMSVQDIVNTFSNGKVAVDLLTILPAQRLDQIRDYLIDRGYAESVVDAALDPKQYADHPVLVDKPPLASLEGYLYPESFQITASTSLETIIRAALDELDLALTPAIRKSFADRGLNLHEALTLASIVEREVNTPDDRAIVAQVFLLRLENGMALGSDVTAFYGASLLGREESVLVDTAYNTRIHAGLPPGPISNVSVTSLQALAKPSNTDYLFFVSGDDGKTYFSHTVAEHEALVAAHCKELCN